MANLSVNSDLYKEVARLLGLPPRVISLDLHMSVKEIPTVTITFFPEINGETATKTFRIEEFKNPKE